MSEGLKSFLSELAVDPEKLALYQKNPEKAMKERGLSAKERAALKSGDPAEVYAVLSEHSASTKSSGKPPAPHPICLVKIENPPICVVEAHITPAGVKPPPICVVQFEVTHGGARQIKKP
jgi:hypothetical protein